GGIHHRDHREDPRNGALRGHCRGESMDGNLTNWMLVFVRAGAFLSILPIFTMLNVPMQVRLAMAALLAVLIAPTLPPLAVAPAGMLDWIGLYTRETFSGLLLGFITRMVFFTSDFAGQVISNELGLNMASVFDPA